jgi:transposase
MVNGIYLLTVDHIDVEATIKTVQQLLAEETHLSPALRSILEVMILLVKIMANRLTLNSRNSSKPPSTDRFANSKKTTKDGSGKKSGGQPGRIGTTLEKIDAPDVVKPLKVDRSTLPPGDYAFAGFDCRQVFDIDIRRVVTEYQAEILENQHGQRFTTPFPAGVSKSVQYGNGIKAQSVYLSQYQLIPYKRVQEYFQDQLALPISEGSIFAYNRQAYELLAQFEQKVIVKLLNSKVLHADETGINIAGKTHWLHCVSSPLWTLYYAHGKRGIDAMNSKELLTLFGGILVHDHWKPYFTLACRHALCNAHHLRELAFAHEQEGQAWAKLMIDLLETILQAVYSQDGALPEDQAAHYLEQYRALLKQAELECPPPPEPEHTARKKGRLKRSKSRNLLERLLNFEQETLRFMIDADVPFTNNQGENDIRMTKLHQKISGCFRSKEGADMFCRVRSYLSTCRKNNVSATDALTLLFEGKLPDFIL